MFSSGTFPQTYFGPIVASGDTVRRLRSSGMAQAEFAGNERAYQPKKMGIGAGSGAARYQQGIASDSERAKRYTEAMQPLGDYQRAMANAQFDFETGSAAEQAGIRDLLLMQRSFNQDADITMRGMKQGEELDMRKLGLDKKIAARQRGAEGKANTLNNVSKGLGLAAKFIL
jgi:hypothetical protein